MTQAVSRRRVASTVATAVGAIAAAASVLATQAPARPLDAPRLLAASVPVYGRAEAELSIATSATRPYYPFAAADDGYGHPDGITVDAEVAGPEGVAATVPAFLYTPYVRADVDGTREALGITGPPVWRVRYAPPRAGRYTLTVRVVDRDGTRRSSPAEFTATASTGRGFIRVFAPDPRFLVYDNGDDVVPIAEGRQWAPTAERRSLSYAEAFAGDAAAGVSLTRLWDQNDGYNLSVEGVDPVWTPGWSQFTTALGIDRTGARTGRRAARFAPRSGTATEGYAQWIAVRPRTTYALSGWIRTRALEGGAFLAVRGSSHLQPGDVRTPPVSGTHEWTQVTTTFRTRDDEHATLLFAGGSGAAGEASIDDVSLVAAGTEINAVSDPGFERHFPRADRGNDPEDPAVARELPVGTEINQWSAYQLDEILGAAEAHGIAVEVCHHGDVYWTWDATIRDDAYAKANGWTTGWTDPRHLGYWKRALRYRIARWSAYTSVLAWEVWNEHGMIDVPSDLHAFYQALGAFVADTDPHHHLFTTSQGSQAYSPRFWATTPTAVVNYHDYMTTENRRHPPALTEDAAAFVAVLANGLVRDWPADTPRKPIVWGEIGTLKTWDVADPVPSTGEGGRISRHAALWAGLFSAALTSPIDWQTVPKAESTRALRAFFAGEPYAHAGWRTFATADAAFDAASTVTTSTPDLRVMALLDRDATRLLAWLRHRGFTWAAVARDGRTPVAAQGTFTTPPLVAGNYTIEWWDTRAGRVTTTTVVAHAGGPVTVATPPIATDAAVKIRRTQ